MKNKEILKEVAYLKKVISKNKKSLAEANKLSKKYGGDVEMAIGNGNNIGKIELAEIVIKRLYAIYNSK